MSEAFALIGAQRADLGDLELSELVTQTYNGCIDPADPEVSALRHAVQLLHLSRIAAHALEAWSGLDPEGAQEYVSRLVRMCTELQAVPAPTAERPAAEGEVRRPG